MGLMLSGAYDYAATKNRKNQSAMLNNETYYHYRDMLENIACARPNFEGMPPEIDMRYVTRRLINRGLVIFYYDEFYDKFFCLSGTPSGQLNPYGNPVMYRAQGANGYYKDLLAGDCAPIWLNYTRTCDIPKIEYYARRFMDIERTIDVALKNQKHPIVLKSTELARLTAENILAAYYGNEPVVHLTLENGADISDLSYMSPDAPYITDKLLADMAKIWNNCMTAFGVDNANQDKKERLVSDEVSANNNQIEMVRLSYLDCWRRGCEEVFMKFGVEIEANFNTDWLGRNYEVANDAGLMLDIEDDGEGL